MNELNSEILWSRAWPLLLILALAIVGWVLLAVEAGTSGAPDYDKATTWARDILGIASTLAGFLGIAAATNPRASAETRVASAEGGGVGLLAGVTLLSIGASGAASWGAPLALAVAVLGISIERGVRAMKGP